MIRTLGIRFGCASSASAIINLSKFDLHRLEYDRDRIPRTATITKQECLLHYKELNTMRKMEIACDLMYKNQQIRGFLHLYDGQQAIAEGIEAAITHEDPLIAGYRIHCQAYKRGYSVHQIVAQLLGKSTGATRGKGGSMHFYSKKHNFYGGHGIVGAQIPLGAGLAFALKYMNRKNVAVCLLGDGAMNQGQVFEAANMAYLWKLPYLMVIENNGFGMGTSVERASMNPDLYLRGDVIPGLRVNGGEVFAVRECMKWAKDYALKHGPLIIEFMTYRYHGHSMSDPGMTYRTREEVQESRKTKDPILHLRKVILEHKFATEEELDESQKIEEDTKEHLNGEVKKAQVDPIPEAQELIENVYSDNQKHFKRGIMIEDSFIPQGSKY